MFFVIGLCTLVVFCLLVILIFVRNSEIQEQQKNVKIKDILLSVASLKLDPNQFTSNDDWAICYDEFSNGQAIIRLPCNAKHYFHAECIGNWIERKTECPIWKAQITEEILDKFKHAEPNKEDFSKERRLDSNFELN